MCVTNRIDVHHHFVPDFYHEALQSSGGDPSGWFIPDWTPELDAKVNTQFGITTSDVLKADGVVLLTRYGEDNHYLGHPDFKYIWAALNRRSAVVLVHPTHPVDTSQVRGLPQPVIRYPFETTQTALDMLYNKTARNNSNCKIILSHAGGTLPFLLSRPASILTETTEELDAFWDDARNFYYDTAVAGSENVMRVMEKFAKRTEGFEGEGQKKT